MRVLLLESEPGVAGDVTTELEDAGHVVVRCREPEHRGFPCRAIGDPGACPLHDGVVDVAVTVRSAASWTPSPGEDGVACALRAGVPLVVAGATAGNPFADWATATTGFDDVPSVCERAAAAPRAALGAAATEKLRDALGRTVRADVETARVEVFRVDGRLRVVAVLPEGVSRRDSELALTRVVARLRELDPEAAGIDVVARTGPASVPV
jgi:hypothetical protein